MITDSGNEQPEDTPGSGRSTRPRGPVLGVVGLVVGLTMGAVFAGGDTEPTVTTTTLPSELIEPSASPTTTTTRPTPPQRRATRVPGLLDNLVIMAADVVGGESAQLWEPLDIEPGQASIPMGNYSGDVSKQWLICPVDQGQQTSERLHGREHFLDLVVRKALRLVPTQTDHRHNVVVFVERNRTNIRSSTADRPLAVDGE